MPSGILAGTEIFHDGVFKAKGILEHPLHRDRQPENRADAGADVASAYMPCE